MSGSKGLYKLAFVRVVEGSSDDHRSNPSRTAAKRGKSTDRMRRRQPTEVEFRCVVSRGRQRRIARGVQLVGGWLVWDVNAIRAGSRIVLSAGRAATELCPGLRDCPGNIEVRGPSFGSGRDDRPNLVIGKHLGVFLPGTHMTYIPSFYL